MKQNYTHQTNRLQLKKWQVNSFIPNLYAEVGKVTLKSNGDEALNDVFSIKSNSDEAFNAQKKL
jgi:hypothetical protein